MQFEPLIHTKMAVKLIQVQQSTKQLKFLTRQLLSSFLNEQNKN